MKKKIKILAIVISITILGVFSSSKTPDANASYCRYGYRTTTGWPGNCVNCNCIVWNVQGKDLCKPVEPQ